MLKKQFRYDIITLKSLYNAFRASESFCASDDELTAYGAFSSHLDRLCAKYGKTRRQIAGALNV